MAGVLSSIWSASFAVSNSLSCLSPQWEVFCVLSGASFAVSNTLQWEVFCVQSGATCSLSVALHADFSVASVRSVSICCNVQFACCICVLSCAICVLHADFSVASGAVEWKVEGESVLLHHSTLHHTEHWTLNTQLWSLNTAPHYTMLITQRSTLNTEHWTSCSGCSGCRLTVHCTSCSQHTCLLSVGWRFCFNIAWWWMDIIASMVDQLSVKTKSITVLQIKVYKTNIEYTNLKFHLFLVTNLKFHLFLVTYKLGTILFSYQ